MRIEAEFERVSVSQFAGDMQRLFPSEAAEEAYGKIKLPKRATAGSAGYDLFTPVPIKLAPGETATVPTGIRAKIPYEWFLMCCPRSGLGFKYRLRLDNTVGIIDSDYYFAENEGHIMIKITNESLDNKTLTIEAGSAFAQGIFLPYGICEADGEEGVRTGGFGSTG
ncbi:MAG: deoxyuridine 5'-triphosphate nucleotidohydrolase [Oscillospiraceae bacterium]|nr:deoxyuridine 5'-triphosphate nucleotidohydrolase [Oscillospiraceae bacterium]